MHRKWLAGLAAGGLAVAGMTSVAAAAPAVAATVIHVGPGGNDTSGCGAAATPCASIPFAYGQAAAGDTIKVVAGTYVMTAPLLIAKNGLRLEGAKAGVDARTRTPGGPGESVIKITQGTQARDIWVANADSVTINGFTFEGNADGAGVSASEQHSGYQVSDDIFADNLKGFAPSSNGTIPSVFDKNFYFRNNNNTEHLGNEGNGVFTYRPLASARFTNSKFLGNGNAPVNIAGSEVPGGSKNLTISHNDMNGEFGVTLVAVSDVVVSGNDMHGGWNGVQVSGACHDITITHNTITGKTRGGILLFTGFAAVTNTGITVADNTIEHTGTYPGRYAIEISRTSGTTIRRNLIAYSGHDGIGFTARGQQVPSTATTISQNTIIGSGGPGIYVAPGTYTGPMIVRYNRIVDNDPHRGLVNDAAAAHIDALLNWWGCNHMPAGAGCDHPAGTDAVLVSFRPWLILAIRSHPASIRPGQHATITATLRLDSADEIPAGPFFLPVKTTFSASPDQVRPIHVTISALLNASTNWPSGQPRPLRICATIDHQTICLHFKPPPPGQEPPFFPVTG